MFGRTRAQLTGGGVAGNYRMTRKTVFVLLLLTGLYLLLLKMLPSNLRMALFAGGVLMILGFWNPRPALWLPAMPFVFLFGGSSLAIGVFYPSGLTLAMMAFFAFYLVHKIVWNEKLPPSAPAIRLAVLALILQAASIVLSIHLHGQYAWNAIREGSGYFLFMPLVFMVPDLCRDRGSVDRLAKAMIIGLFVAGLAGVLEYASISTFSRVDMSIGYVYKGRVASLLGNANVFSGYLELSVPLALAVGLWSDSFKWKLFAFGSVILGMLSVLYTFSRGGLLSVTLGAGAVLLFRFRRKPWIPILIGLIFVGLVVSNAQVFERQLTFFQNPQELSSQPTLLHRYVTYRALWHQFTQTPLLGIGWGAKEFYWGRTSLYSFWEVRHVVSTSPIKLFGGLNSLLLSTAVKGGLVSLVSLLLIVLAAFRASLTALRSKGFPWAVGLVAGLLGFAVHQTMDNFLYWPQTNSFFWLSIGLLVAIGCCRTDPAGGPGEG